jgi:hypothetical protein
MATAFLSKGCSKISKDFFLQPWFNAPTNKDFSKLEQNFQRPVSQIGLSGNYTG